MKKQPALTDRSKQEHTTKHLCIKVGIDWHARKYVVSRIIDNGTPEPAQKFTPAQFLIWIVKQKDLALEVVTCYEAGPGGFVLHRQLESKGIRNIMVAPRKLDPHNRRVVNDKTDCRELAMDLDRFLRGNNKALRTVYVPSPEGEQKRHLTRRRNQMQKERLRMATRGRCLLLAQGVQSSNNWWKSGTWEKLRSGLPQWIVESLEDYRGIILAVDEKKKDLEKEIRSKAPKLRPKGMGALTMQEIDNEVVTFERFNNRKAPGSYVGLTGGVSSTGDATMDLSITKAGNRRLRTILVELAWRFAFYQPDSRTMRRWAAILTDPKAHARAKKRAVVAAARNIFVDLWRWRTGRVTPEQLGWIMSEEVASEAAA